MPHRKSSIHSAHADPRPPATAPDSLVHVGERRVDTVRIRVIDYCKENVRELDNAEPAACKGFEGSDTPVWISVTGLHDPSIIQKLLSDYEIHPLIQQDILNTTHVAKLEDLEDALFLTLRLIQVDAKREGGWTEQQFSLLLTDRVLFTFTEEPTSAFDPVIARLRSGTGKLRAHGPDYLMWALLDAVVDHALISLRWLEEQIYRQEEALATTRNLSTMQSLLHELRGRAAHFHRSVRPYREISLSLQRMESPLLTAPLSPFLRDLYDHSLHALELSERIRDSILALRDLHQNLLAQRLNEVMKVLAAISTIFLPLTFLAGVYGMNFDYMPELRMKLGYPMIWLVFILLTAFMLWCFRRRKWL